jgi:hypothetical protein
MSDWRLHDVTEHQKVPSCPHATISGAVGVCSRLVCRPKDLSESSRYGRGCKHLVYLVLEQNEHHGVFEDLRVWWCDTSISFIQESQKST